MAPANIRDSRMAAALLHFAARYAHGLPATLDVALPQEPPKTAEELRHIEATHQVWQLHSLLFVMHIDMLTCEATPEHTCSICAKPCMLHLCKASCHEVQFVGWLSCSYPLLGFWQPQQLHECISVWTIVLSYCSVWLGLVWSCLPAEHQYNFYVITP